MLRFFGLSIAASIPHKPTYSLNHSYSIGQKPVNTKNLCEVVRHGGNVNGGMIIGMISGIW